MTASVHLRPKAGVHTVMRWVLFALLPGIGLYVWQFGPAILVSLVLSSLTALLCEALMLSLRRRPLWPSLSDGSALVAAWLVSLCFPPIAPWWLIVLGTASAIILVKHLYGGLGQNPFNPAMAAYCLMIVSFPAIMAQWPSAQSLDWPTQLDLIFGSPRPVDALTGATALDTLRTGLRAEGAQVSAILESADFGLAGGKGWEWLALGYLVGGLFLVAKRVITWHLPVAFILTMALLSGFFGWLDPTRFASPLFHLASGGAMLAAFFILTDPVSGATTPRGKLLFGAGVALLAWLIRHFGAFPEGIAFGVLLMNLCVPLIDMKTQPPVFGHKTRSGSQRMRGPHD
jgi:Na+-translocating ferredoxin:NAD+ oxidoreductase subunit D